MQFLSAQRESLHGGDPFTWQLPGDLFM
jgi:hypothetical protein